MDEIAIFFKEVEEISMGENMAVLEDMVMLINIDYILFEPWRVLTAWILIGYLHTYILRFVLGVPCRLRGDSLESSYFV